MNYYEKFGLVNGLHPTDGWGIFWNTEKNVHEVQRIDEQEILKDDDEALELAHKAGVKTDNPDNPYEVTGGEGMLTQKDVWGKWSDDRKLLSRGMIVAQGVPSGISVDEKKKIQDKIKVPDWCPVWHDLLGDKSVTVICTKEQEDEVRYWLEYVQGGGSVSMRKELKVC